MPCFAGAPSEGSERRSPLARPLQGSLWERERETAGKRTFLGKDAMLTTDGRESDFLEHRSDERERPDPGQAQPTGPSYLPEPRAYHLTRSCLNWLARNQPRFIHLVRIAIFVVMAWIGGLKFVPYEAESIVPLIANSPVMSFFYARPAPEYKQYMNNEGEVVPKNRAWHQENRTYVFADALGAVIVIIGILMLLGLFSPKIGIVGALLTIGMSCVTLSFLITTPEAWVAHFPYLSGGGRLVVKDVIMLSAALVCLSSSARELLRSMDRHP
jgi:uncharacterized membrane protein YkgB